MTLTIGSDPEFAIVDPQGNLACAMCIFTGSYETCKTKKCENMDDNDCYINEDNELFDTSIGCDYQMELGELRPKYGRTPVAHHNNIKKLIHQIEVPDGFKVLAGTVQRGNSLGGHIHFGGIPEPINRDDNLEHWYLEMENMSNYLSYYAGIPLRMLEYKKDLLKRGFSQYGYGGFGNHRTKNYGLEWRMPASWLVSSEIALAALCLSYVVAYEYTINPEKITMDQSTCRLLVESKKIDNILEKIEGMQKYGLYSKKMDPIFQLIVDGKKWKKDVNILDMW